MGGLGNQMFQLASAYAYSKKYNGNLKILKNKREEDGRSLYWDSLLSNFNKYIVDRIQIDLVQWNEKSPTEYSIIPPLTNKGIYLNGYLQSPKYFEDELTQNEIRNLFKPPKKYIDVVVNKYKSLIENKERIIVVHARRTDYLKNQQMIETHGPLTVEYYKESINKICQRVKNPFFLLISDDSSFWLSILNDISELVENEIYILNDENEVNTFILLQQFHNFIIANSTFSWWGAWMANEPKIVYAPSKWFGPAGPKNYTDIYISNWNLI
jgi:hypothetical protein